MPLARINDPLKLNPGEPALGNDFNVQARAIGNVGRRNRCHRCRLDDDRGMFLAAFEFGRYIGDKKCGAIVFFFFRLLLTVCRCGSERQISQSHPCLFQGVSVAPHDMA